MDNPNELPLFDMQKVVEPFKALAEGTAKAATAAPAPEEVQQRRDDNATHDIKLRVARNSGGKKERIKQDWAAKARQFRQANPAVWEKFVEITNSLVERGHKHLGVELIFNVIRWQTMLETTDDTGFKINSNYKAAFSRMFMEEYPQHSGLFLTRESAADGVDL